MAKERKFVGGDGPAEGMAAAFLEPLESFRLGFISLLAALIGILAGLIAYVLYDLIGLFTKPRLLPRVVISLSEPGEYASWPVDHRHPCDRRTDRGVHGEVRLGKN